MGLWIIMLMDSYKDLNSYKHLDFLSISRFKTPLAISRVKRWVLHSILICISYY
jgi:hypothetical protein